MTVSRIPTLRPDSYCFNPVHVKDGDKDIIVPCGKCDGCRLHKANDWSMRVRQEIDATPFSIFFTLTYNNHYLPKLHRYGHLVKDQIHDSYEHKNLFWTSNTNLNVRFNGKVDVMRKDDIFIPPHYSAVPVQNYEGLPCINYASKNDIQLWLKLLRKDILENLFYGRKEYFEEGRTREDIGFFRYYIISEVGPTTQRNHFHGLIFPNSYEIAVFLTEYCMYQNWQMCDKDLFQQYVKFCTSGAGNYVTNYLTCPDNLCSVYQENKELRPFRLASKSPAIGFVEHDKAEVFGKVIIGDLLFSRTIQRLGSTHLVQYSKDFANRIFPKCYRYRFADYRRLLWVYGYLLRADFLMRLFGMFFPSGLVSLPDAMDADASRACANFFRPRFRNSRVQFIAQLEKLNLMVGTYLYALDMYYYKRDMITLSNWYREQELDPPCNNPLAFCKSLVNIHDFVSRIGDDYVYYCFMEFLSSIGLKDADPTSLALYFKYECPESYKREVEDIIQNSVKRAKSNELLGKSPHIV